MNKININDQFTQLKEEWAPKVIAQSNDQAIRVIKGSGELGWHKHDNEEKIVIVYKGQLTLKLNTGEIVLKAGEMYVVPKGLEHCPVATPDTHFMMIEPAQ